MIALGFLAPATLGGCGYTLERTSQVEARELALTTAEARGHSLERQVSELKRALEAERRATQEAVEAEQRMADDFAFLERRLRASRVQVAALERGRVTTDTPAPAAGDGTEAAQQRLAELEQQAAEAEAHRRALQAEAASARQNLEERQQAADGVERRLQALRAEVATAEAQLADRHRELAELREQVARERGTGAPSSGGESQPEGGGPVR